MKYKASLHLHIDDDFKHGKSVKYSIYNLIDEAFKLDFKILGLTGHRTFLFKPEYGEYARKKGVLLIPGIEVEVNKRHCLILNCDVSAEKIKKIADLIDYKKNHPDCFIIAPHPNYKAESLGLSLIEKNPDVFDAIEKSWFFSERLNLNRRAEQLAHKLKKPFIATADLHQLDHLNDSYSIIKSDDLEIVSIFEAIRFGRFENFSKTQWLPWMIFYFSVRTFCESLESIKRLLIKLKR